METIVMKFGGAAVAGVKQVLDISEIILSQLVHARIVVVVSAMGNTTDQLIGLARQIHPRPPEREQDMLISVGERISMSLLAMALHLKNQDAISLTGSQSGIITSSVHSEAQIIDVRPHRLEHHLQEGKVVIVAGFQGVSQEGEITTLGRGGSDTTAVALGVALGASKIEFYKDVPGIFSEDPKKNPDAICFSHLSYQDALVILDKGAEVLHTRSVKLAQKNGSVLHVRSFYDPDLSSSQGTVIGVPLKTSLNKKIYESVLL